jgi:hypothetical protein
MLQFNKLSIRKNPHKCFSFLSTVQERNRRDIFASGRSCKTDIYKNNGLVFIRELAVDPADFNLWMPFG